MSNLQQRINDRLSEKINQEVDMMVDDAIAAFFGRRTPSVAEEGARRLIVNDLPTPGSTHIHDMISHRIADELGLKSLTELNSSVPGIEPVEELECICDKVGVKELLRTVETAYPHLRIDRTLAAMWPNVRMQLDDGRFYEIKLQISNGSIHDYRIKALDATGVIYITR